MSAGKNTLRIIGGEYRGRRMPFANIPGLRPTADRVRETLFNWLQGEVTGRRVLDLFAGSGALGIEALSRGAAEVVLVEKAYPAVQQLRKNLEGLKALEHSCVEPMDALAYLQTVQKPFFDIVFLDPPFADSLLPETCAALQASGCLTARAWVYLEQSVSQDWPDLPVTWQIYRESQAGQVRFCLCRYQG